MTRLPRYVVALVVATLILSACAPGAPPAPAKDAPAAGAPAAKATTAPAQAAPAAPAKPSQTAGQTLVLAIEGQPESLDPQAWGGGSMDTFYHPSVFDGLVGRDPKTREITPRLAKSWERVNDTTWRFKLQEGVTFHNGESFTAKAVELAVNRMADPQSTLNGKRYFPTLAGAAVVDDLTIDVTTTQPDPILPDRLFFLMIGEPGWLQANAGKTAAEPTPGTGPYKLAEWQRDQQMRLVANDAYWGTPKPSIGEIKILYRREASVRANMVKSGEANIAIQIAAEDAGGLPKTARQQTVEVAYFKINTGVAPLDDLRVRKAIAHSIDVKTISETIYAGVATPANSLVGPSATGWNPDLAAYPYQPEEAKRLVSEAGAEGKELTMVYRIGWPTKVEELSEAIANYVSKTGLKVKLAPAELAKWQEINRSNGPGAGKPELFVSSHGNDLMDSASTFETYYRCQASLSLACDAEFEKKIAPAVAKSGSERQQALRDLWKEAVELYMTMPLFSLDYVHGLSTNVEWEPRVDGYVYYNTMRLTQ